MLKRPECKHINSKQLRAVFVCRGFKRFFLAELSARSFCCLISSSFYVHFSRSVYPTGPGKFSTHSSKTFYCLENKVQILLIVNILVSWLLVTFLGCYLSASCRLLCFSQPILLIVLNCVTCFPPIFMAVLPTVPAIAVLFLASPHLELMML